MITKHTLDLAIKALKDYNQQHNGWYGWLDHIGLKNVNQKRFAEFQEYSLAIKELEQYRDFTKNMRPIKGK